MDVSELCSDLEQAIKKSTSDDGEKLSLQRKLAYAQMEFNQSITMARFKLTEFEGVWAVNRIDDFNFELDNFFDKLNNSGNTLKLIIDKITDREKNVLSKSEREFLLKYFSTLLSKIKDQAIINENEMKRGENLISASGLKEKNIIDIAKLKNGKVIVLLTDYGRERLREIEGIRPYFRIVVLGPISKLKKEIMALPVVLIIGIIISAPVERYLSSLLCSLIKVFCQ